MEAVRRLWESQSTFWVANHDIDEYLLPVSGMSLRTTLLPYTKSTKGTPHSFVIFDYEVGSSGWEMKPPGLTVLEAFRYADQTRGGNGKAIALLDAIDRQEYHGYPHRNTLKHGEVGCSLIVRFLSYCPSNAWDAWGFWRFAVGVAVSLGLVLLCTAAK